MSKKIFLIIFLISGFAFSQTTVTLQDQCNCEVLSGTAVTAPGAAAPTGADIGDIYVNTNTGTIYFWDGNSWELTSSDNQQLQNFSFNAGTNQLTLVLENGGSLSVDLSILNNIGTDDQTASEVIYDNSTSGLSAGTVQSAIDELKNTANTVNLVDNTDGTYTFTKSDGSTVTISDTSVSTLINNGDSTFTYTSEDGSTTLIDIRDFETLTTIALNADDTNIDYTDEDGVVTQLNLSAIVDNLETVTTLVANANGTFTYKDEDGVDTIIDVKNLETLTTIALNADDTNIDYTDEDGVVTQLNLSAIVDNLETVTTLVANANGTFTYKDEDGVDTIIDVKNLETLTTIALNADDTNIDYTDEDGVVTQLNLSALVDNLETVTTLVANADGTFTYRDEDGVDTIIDVKNLETLTTIALNADDTNIDYTDEDGVVTQLNLSAIVDNLETVTTLVANANGTFTYKDEDGVDTIIDVKNLETLTTIALNADDTNIDYTDEDGVVTQLNLSAIVDNLETVTTLVANANGTFTYKDEDGVDTIIDVKNLETLTTIALNADDTNIDYTDEDGVVTQLNLSAIVDNLETVTTLVANANGTFTYTDEDGIDTIIDITNLETLTTIALNADNTNIDYTDEDGVVTQLNLSALVDNLETVTTLVANANGTFTYKDEDGVDTIIDVKNLETLTTIALNADDTNIDYTDEDGVVTQLNLSAIVDNLETVTTLVANANGTFTYTDEDGVDTIIDVKNLETLTTIALNADNTNIDYTDEDGVVTQLNLSALVDNLETVTTLVANANGTFTYKDEDGVDTIIDVKNLETLTTIALNADDTNIDYTDEDGVVTQLNLSAIVDNLETVTTLVANANGTFTYKDEDGVDTIIDVKNLETLTTIALNADDTNIDYTDEDGVLTQLNLSAIVDNLETVTTLVANANGTFTYKDEDGVDTIIDVKNLETLTTIALNADDTNIDYTDEDGVLTQLNLSAIVDNLETVTTLVANANGTFTYKDEDGVDTIIDVKNLETLTTIALNADDTNIDYTDEDGVVTQLNLSAIVDNLETVTTLVANADGTFTYKDEDGVDTIIDVKNLETLTTIALNIDNTNIDYTDEDGVLTQLNLSAIVDNLETVTTLVANANGTFTYTDEDGVDTIIDVKNLETLTTIALNADDTNIDYTDEDGVLTQLNLSAIVDNLETVTTLVANANGTFTYTDEDGVDTIIDVKNLETLTTIALNADDTNIDYTDEDGVLTQLNLSAIVDNLETVTTLVANANGTFTYKDEDGVDTIIDVKSLETLTTIALNADDTNIDYTDEDGVVTQLNLSAIVDNLETVTTLVANANGTFTYKDEDGVDTIIDVKSLETLTTIALNADDTNIDYTDEDGVVTQLNLSAIVDNLETVTTLVANANGTFTYKDEDGVDTIIDVKNLETLTTIALNADDTNIDYTDEDGVVTQLNLSAIIDNLETVTTIVANANGTFTYTDESGVATVIDIANLETLTTVALNADNTNLEFTDEDGVVNLIDLTPLVENLETLTTMVANPGSTFTYTDEAGVATVIDIANLETLTSILNNGDGTITYTDELGANQTITMLSTDANNDIIVGADGGLYLNVASVTVAETVTDLVDNLDGTITYTNEDGTPQTVSKADITDNADGTYTFTNNDGTDVTINTNGIAISNLIAGNRIATITNAAGASSDINETITTLTDNANGTFTYTSENGTVTTFDSKIASVVDNLDGTYTITDDFGVSVTVDTNNTVTTLVDNGDGSFTYTSEDGTITTFTETLSTLVDNANGTFTYTNEDGVATTFDSKIASVVDNLDGTYTITDDFGVSVTVDTNNTVTTLVDNGDGSFTYTSEDGTITTFTETLSTLVDNANGTFTYTNEDGVATTFDSKIASVVDNLDGTYTITDDFGVSVTVDTNNTVTTLVDNGDGSFTYTSEDGTITTFTETLSTLVDNANGTFTYTNEDGVATTFDSKIASVVDNLDGTYTITDDFGVSVTVDTNNTVTTLVDNGDGSFTYTSEDGTITTFTETLSTLVDNANGTFTYTNEDGVATMFDAKRTTALDNGDGTFTITDDSGNTVNIDSNQLAGSLVNNGDGTITYTDGTGPSQTIDLISNDANNDIVVGTDGGLYLNVASVTISETITNISDTGDGTITYVNESGTTQKVNKANIIDNLDGTYTFTNNDGSDVIINTNGVAISNVIAGNRIATVTDAAGTVTDIDETITTLADNGNGTFTYTSENGTVTNFDAKRSTVVDNADGTYTITDDSGTAVVINTNQTTSSLVDNGNGTYTYTDETGTPQVIDTRANSNPYNNVPSGLIATDVQGALDELAASNAADNDTDPTNEVNTTFAVVGTDLQITDSSGTLSVPLSDLGSDDQTITAFSMDAAKMLTITLEDGNTQTVDLSSLNNSGTDDQTVTDFSMDAANVLTITLEDGNTRTVDLSSLNNSGSDDQALSLAGNILTLEDGGTVDLTPYLDNIDNQQISLVGNILTLGNGTGADTTVDLSGYISTDDQALSLAGNTLTLEDGGTVDLAPYLDNTDDQIVTAFSMDAAKILTITLENGNTQTVDLSSLNNSGTDDQALSLVGNTLTLEDGGTVDLTPYLDNIDNQQISFAGNILTLSNGTGADTTVDLSGYISTDDQALSLVGNTLTLEDGGTVDLTPYLDNSDDQAITTFSLDNVTNILTLTLEDGGTQTVDFSAVLAAADTNTTNTRLEINGSDLELEDSDGAVLSVSLAALAAATDTDDQTLSIVGDQLSISEGNTVTVPTADGTETKVNAGSNVTVAGDGSVGTPYVVSVASLDDADADPNNEIQTLTSTDGSVTLTPSGNDYDLSVAAADGTETKVNAGTNVTVAGDGSIATPYVVSVASLDDADADPTNEYNTGISLVGSNLTVTDAGGNQTVDISGVNTDTQDLSIDATGKIISLVDGGSVTIDADDADADPTNELSDLNLAANILTLTNPATGGNQVDLSSYVNTDTQDLSIDATGKIISLVDGGSVTIDADDADADPVNEIQTLTSTDGSVTLTPSGNDYDLSVAAADGTETKVNAGTNVTVAGDGSIATPYVVSVATLDDADADPTNEYNTGISLVGSNLTVTDAGGNQTVDISGVNTDTQDLSIDATGKIISLVDGGSVTIDADDADADPTNELITSANLTGTDLNIIDAGGTTTVDLSSLNNSGTDDQTLTLVGNNLSIEDGNTVVLPTADGTETKVNAGTNVTVAGDGSIATPYVVSVATLDDADADPSNEIQTLTSTDGSVTLVKTGDDYDFSVAAADGTETKVNAGTNVTVAGDGSIATPYVVSVASLDDADADPTNELSDLNLAANILTLTNPATGGNQVDLSSYVNTDTQDLSIDATGKIISLVDGGSVTIDANDADADPTNEYNTALGMNAGSLEITDGGGTLSTGMISTDANNDIAFGADGKLYLNVASVTISETITNLSDTGDGTVTYVNENGITQKVNKANITDNGNGTYTFTNNDGSDVVLDTRANSNPYNNVPSGLTATNVQAAIDELAAGSTDSQTLSTSGAAGDITISGGNNISINVNDADADPTNEIQTLTSTDGSVALVKTGDDYDFSVAAADGTETKVNAGTNVTVAGDGSIATPYVVSVASLDDADADPTNELITSANLTGTDLNIIDAGGTTTVDLSSLNNSGTDDQTLTLVGNNLSIEDGNTVVLPTADGTETKVNAGTNVTVAGDGSIATPYVVSVATLDDADADPSNEIQTLTSTDGSVTLVKTGDDYDFSVAAADGTETKVNAGTNVTVAGDGSIATPYVVSVASLDDADADPTNELITSANLTGTDLNIIDAGGTTTVDLSSLNNSGTDDQTLTLVGNNLSIEDGNTVVLPTADGTETKVNAGANVTVAGDGSIATPYVVSVASLDDADADPANEIQTLTSTDGSVTLVKTGEDYDFSVAAADGSETKVTGAGINTVSGTGTLADPYVITGTEVDGSVTNEIQTLTSTDGSVTLVKTGDDYDFSVAAADGTETKVNAGTNVTVAGDGSIATPYVVSVASLDDADADPTNELITSANLTGTDLNIIDAGGTTTVDLSSLNNSGTDDQTLTLVGNNLSIEDGNTVVLPTADGTETKVNAGANVTVAGNGSIATPYVVSVATLDDADADPTNEYNTGISLVGSNLTVTDAGGNQTVDISGVNTDTQDLSIDATGKIISLVDGGSVTIDADDADADPTNEYNTGISLVGSNLTVTDAGGNQTVDISGVNTDTQDLSIDATGKIISLVDGGSVTIDADDADADPTNELTDLNLAANILTLTNPATGGNQVDLSSYVNTDTQDLSIDATGKIISLVDGGSVTIDADDADADPTNEIQTLTSTDGSVTLTPSGDDYDLSVAVADGSETKVTGAGINTVTGSGTTASPYVVTGTEVDGSTINEVNTAFGVVGTNLSITDSNGTLSVPLASIGSDNQVLSTSGAAGNITIEDGNTININVNDADNVVGNEYNTNFAVSGTDLVITDGGGPRAVSLASLGSDDQKIDKFVLNGTTLELSVENDGEADKTVNLNGTFATDAELAASDAADLDKVVGNEVTGPTDGTLVRNGSGNTASPYTLDVATGGITTTEILNGTIATVDLADNSVNSAKIVNGTIATADIASTGNNKVLTTSPAGVVEWIDKSTLVPTTTVSNTSSANTLSTTVNGVTGAGVNIINSNALSLTGSDLRSTVNGVASAPLNLSTFLDNTDDQTAAEVNVVTPVDVDGDGTNETTVEAAIQEMAPIVSKAARIFYPPSIAVDASTTGTGRTINLYTQYTAQYATPAVASAGAPPAIPTYGATQLYYYVTYFDPAVFANVSVNASGVMTYDIIASPSDYNSLINVVFVVK